MSTQKKNQSDAANQPGDPLFNLHHAEAEAALQREDPTALTTRGLSANESVSSADDEDADSDGTAGPLDSQGQRRGQPLSTPEMGSGAGHH